MYFLTEKESRYITFQFYKKLKILKKKLNGKIIIWKTTKDRDKGVCLSNGEDINFHHNGVTYSSLKIEVYWISNKPLKVECLNNYVPTSWDNFDFKDKLNFDITIENLFYWMKHLEDHLTSDMFFYFFEKKGNERVRKKLTNQKKNEKQLEIVKKQFIDKNIPYKNEFFLNRDRTVIDYKQGMIYPAYTEIYESKKN